MNKCLIDTDIFSEILKGKNQEIVRNAQNYRGLHGHYTLSVITVLEVVKGFQRLSREEQLQQVLSNLSLEEIVPVDIECSILAGRIYGDLERTGQPIG